MSASFSKSQILDYNKIAVHIHILVGQIFLIKVCWINHNGWFAHKLSYLHSQSKQHYDLINPSDNFLFLWTWGKSTMSLA